MDNPIIDMSELYEEISRKLHDRRLDIVSRESGVGVLTIARVRDGKATNPTLDTLNKLWNYLETHK